MAEESRGKIIPLRPNLDTGLESVIEELPRDLAPDVPYEQLAAIAAHIAGLYESRIQRAIGERNQAYAERDNVVNERDAYQKLNDTLVAERIVGAREKEALRQYALSDELTGLLNRRGYEARLEEALNVASRYNDPLSLLIIDIDHFKQVNDTYGHAGGDFVLKEVARRINEGTRQGGDVAARFGGEEIAIIAQKTALEGASVLAENVRKLVYETPVIYNEQSIPVTISIGVAAYEKEMTSDKLFKRADDALYQAKNAGRNRVVLYSLE